MTPILIGDPAAIETKAKGIGWDLGGCDIVAASGDEQTIATAIAMVVRKDAEVLMKGGVRTEQLMRGLVKARGLVRPNRRLSHVYQLRLPGTRRDLLVSDAGINVNPDVDGKFEITVNAIEAAHRLGLAKPRVALLSAVEYVNPSMPSSAEAFAVQERIEKASLSCEVHGPLAFDNTISQSAAKQKGLTGSVAGKADIIIVHSIEVGNALAKCLIYCAGAAAAGIVLGAKVPIVLTSRSDSDETRINGIVLASRLAGAW